MRAWNIRTFTASGSRKPVEEWIRGLQPRAQAEVILTVELLEEYGPGLSMPHARHLEDGIWELRARVGRNVFRILYFHWKSRTFGLLHGFTKKTERTPRAEIEIARERRAAWHARAETRQRKQ